MCVERLEPILHVFTYFAYNSPSMQVILPFHCARTKVCNGNGSATTTAAFIKRNARKVIGTIHTHEHSFSDASVSQSLSHFAHFLRHGNSAQAKIHNKSNEQNAKKIKLGNEKALSVMCVYIQLFRIMWRILCAVVTVVRARMS